MADILISGIEDIPVGQEFVIVENIDFERYLYNRETGAVFHLISLPEGHGRLGDLDALESELAFEYAYAAAKVCRNAPTIIPAEGHDE